MSLAGLEKAQNTNPIGEEMGLVALGWARARPEGPSLEGKGEMGALRAG